MQREGMLPSAALKKLEIERRTSPPPEKKKGLGGLLDFSTTDKIFLGAIGLSILYVYFTWKPLTVVKSRMSMSSPASLSVPTLMTLEDVPGIDTGALQIARKKFKF